MICSHRSSARLACPQPQTDCDEHLLTSLCELTRQLDPVPEHITGAARSAFSAATSRPEAQLATSDSEQCHADQNCVCSAYPEDQVSDIVP